MKLTISNQHSWLSYKTGCNLIILAAALVSCQDYVFGLYGQQSQFPINTSEVDPQITFTSEGVRYSCTWDEHCDAGLFCYKKDPYNNYVGLCSQIK